MDAAREYWKDWIGYWGYVSAQAMDRWYKASSRVRREEYGTKSLIADVVGFWTDSTEAFIGACRGSTRMPQPLIFRVGTKDECAGPKYVKYVNVFSPALPNTNPDVIWLGRVDGRKSSPRDLSRDNLLVTFTDNKSQLEVQLVDLGLKTPLELGSYRAMVRIDEVPIAEVLIVVQEITGPGEEQSVQGNAVPRGSTSPTARSAQSHARRKKPRKKH